MTSSDFKTRSVYDLALNLRQKKLSGKPGIRAHSLTADEATSDLDGLSATDDAHNRAAESGSATTFDATPLVENRNVWKVRIPRRWRSKWERRMKHLRRFWLWITFRPELTTEQKRVIEENRRRAQLTAFHMEQAQRAGRLMINALTRLKFCRVANEDGNMRVKSEVSFDHVKVTPYAYYYHVDAPALPYGVDVQKMAEHSVCTNISISVEHPTRVQIIEVDNMITGLIYTIEIAGINGIPNRVSFADMLPLIPSNAPVLAYLVGAAANGRTEIRNLADGPHALIVGETGGGKSNIQNVMIACQVARNTPKDLRCSMIDLKGGGLEAVHWEGLPHLIIDEKRMPLVPTGIAGTVEAALEVLRYARDENQRRQLMFKSEKVKNLDQWNSRFRTRRLPRLVVYLDELALLLEERATKEEVLAIIRNVSSLGRAGGVHVCAATQSPDRSVLGHQSIKVNFGQRIAFAMPDFTQSIIAIGTGDASKLPSAEMTPGRAIYKRGSLKFEVQTPYISNNDIQQVVANAQAGRITASLASQMIQPEDFVRWAVEENDGNLEVRAVYNQFKEKLELHGVERMLKLMDNQIYRVGERAYQVMQGSGRRPRMVVQIDIDLPPVVAETRDEIRDEEENGD